ncbi:MAG: LysR substrate-binding domain-containing protein [Pseudomonadota bacterium]
MHPNWKALIAFEAVARHGSFSHAATELNVLQPAMSRRVAELERALGVHLIHRTRPKLSLSPEGQILFRAISSSLVQVETALEQVRRSGEQSGLVVDTTIGFASCFLLKRLAAFREAHADIAVELISRDLNASFRESEADLIIAFDKPERLPGSHHQLIFSEEMIAVCAPAYAPALSLSPEQLADCRLLHLTQGIHRQDWDRFIAGTGVVLPPATSSEKFMSFTVCLQAALNGEGIAIGWEHLLEDHLAAGHLVRASKRRVATARGYYCCHTARGRNAPRAKIFADWICGLVPGAAQQ